MILCNKLPASSTPKRKKKFKVKKENSLLRSLSMHRVKATRIKLGQLPTTFQFAGLCLVLRLAVAGWCDEPDVAENLIFEIEDQTSDIDNFKSDPNDPLHAMDSKLADALVASPRVTLCIGLLSRPNGRHCGRSSCRAVKRCG